MKYEDDCATLHAPSNTSSYFYQQIWISASYQQSARIKDLTSEVQIHLKSLNLQTQTLWVECSVVAVMVAWPLPSDIWAQAAVRPEHAPSEHRAHHSAHTGVTRSYPQCSAAPATLTVRTVTHSRAHTNIFSKVNIFLSSLLFCVH